MKKLLVFIGFFVISCVAFAQVSVEALTGAWRTNSGGNEEVLIFENGYSSYSNYNTAGKSFKYTYGGPFSVNKKELIITVEFNSAEKDLVGTVLKSAVSVSADKLTTNFNGEKKMWVRIDNGKENLSGCWRINARMDGGKMNEIKPGVRKTLKILSEKRFQWFAINTETKEFFGTGGGTYEFENGKYTEHIEFFSRDSSRVGASLGFDAKLENGVWNHSGLSSKGDPINENWVKISGK